VLHPLCDHVQFAIFISLDATTNFTTFVSFFVSKSCISMYRDSE